MLGLARTVIEAVDLDEALSYRLDGLEQVAA